MSNYEKLIEELKAVRDELHRCAGNLDGFINEVEEYRTDGDRNYFATVVGSIKHQREDYIYVKRWGELIQREKELWQQLYKTVREEKGL